jgi:uncharacterized protein
MVSRQRAEAVLRQGPLAFVGVSHNPKEFSASVYRTLRDRGVALIPVNPGAEEIEGDRCYHDVRQLPDGVAGAIVMVPAARSAEVVDACAERGIERVWLHKGAGPSSVSAEAVARAHHHGLDLVEGACPLMFVEPVRGVHRLHRFARSARGAVTA